MKVSRMEVIPLAIPMDPRYKPGELERIYPVVVRLYTDEGLDSFGICFTFARPKSLVACVEDLRDVIVGQEIMRGAEAWQKLFQATSFMGHRGYPVYALAAIDTALWGLRGCRRSTSSAPSGWLP